MCCTRICARVRWLHMCYNFDRELSLTCHTDFHAGKQTYEQVLGDGLNLLFQKHGMPPIA